jgi:hypothetical protein
MAPQSLIASNDGNAVYLALDNMRHPCRRPPNMPGPGHGTDRPGLAVCQATVRQLLHRPPPHQQTYPWLVRGLSTTLWSRDHALSRFKAGGSSPLVAPGCLAPASGVNTGNAAQMAIAYCLNTVRHKTDG